MSTYPRISALFSVVATAAILISTSHAHAARAAGKATQAVASPDLLFSFNVSCGPNTATGSIELGWAEPRVQDQDPSEFRRRCMMLGNQDGATFFCQCEDNDAAIVGDIDREELIPEGTFPPPGSPFPSPEPMDVVFDACGRVFQKQCTSLPPDLQKSCHNDQGSCYLEALAAEASGGYSEVSASCMCGSGEAWSSGVETLQSQVFTAEQAAEICASELRGCSPEVESAPTDEPWVPESNLETRWAACMRYDPDPDADYPECVVLDDGETALYDCYCGFEEEPAMGSLAKDSWLTRAELFEQCEEVMARSCPLEPDGTPEPGPDTPGDGDDPDMEDVLDKLGCSLGRSGPLGLWMLSPWALGLLAFRRRR